MKNPFDVGDMIHGFAAGYFGRDSYACRRVEALGPDWIVTRNERGALEFVGGEEVQNVYHFCDDRSFCSDDCNIESDIRLMRLRERLGGEHAAEE